MTTTARTYPLVTAPVGDWPMQCIFTRFPVVEGQKVALSPLGYITLLPVRNPVHLQPGSVNPLAYLIAVFQAYERRQGWLPQPEQILQPVAENLLSTLLPTIPPGQSCYLHQLLQTTDLSPWLRAVQSLPATTDQVSAGSGAGDSKVSLISRSQAF